MLCVIAINKDCKAIAIEEDLKYSKDNSAVKLCD